MLIDDGVGATVRERVSALNSSSTECSHTHYLAEGSRTGCGDDRAEQSVWVSE